MFISWLWEGAMNIVREAGRRLYEEEDDSSKTDRLSYLPEPIISDILSLLDTKSAVQTCVLARAWRFAWKQVRVLDLSTDGFQNYSSFRNFVDMVISFRNSGSVKWVRFTDERKWKVIEPSLLARVIEHALAHGAQDLVIELDYEIISDRYRFSDMFGGVMNCCSNLKSLRLRGAHIDTGYDSSGFAMLTTLHLSRCKLISCLYGVKIDFFSSFPCLRDLVITRSAHLDKDIIFSFPSLNLYVPHLLSLRLVDNSFHGTGISAPKLRQCILHGPLLRFSGPGLLSLPSVDHADIQFRHILHGATETHPGWEKLVFEQRLNPLFQSLHNAKSLTLCSLTMKVLSEASELLEQQSCPFTRLECLNLHSNRAPDKVVNYFLKGSSCARPTVEFLST